MELNKAKQQIKEADTAISSQQSEIEKLNHIINEADQERVRQKKEYDVVVNERDILGTQLIRWGRRGGEQGRVYPTYTHTPPALPKKRFLVHLFGNAGEMMSWRCCTRRSRSSRARFQRARFR